MSIAEKYGSDSHWRPCMFRVDSWRRKTLLERCTQEWLWPSLPPSFSVFTWCADIIEITAFQSMEPSSSSWIHPNIPVKWIKHVYIYTPRHTSRGLPLPNCRALFSQGQQRSSPMSGWRGSCTQVTCYFLTVSHTTCGLFHRERMLFFPVLPCYAPDVRKSETCCTLETQRSCLWQGQCWW